MLRVAIDVGPTHGRRTGIGNAVAWTVDALGRTRRPRASAVRDQRPRAPPQIRAAHPDAGCGCAATLGPPIGTDGSVARSSRRRPRHQLRGATDALRPGRVGVRLLVPRTPGGCRARCAARCCGAAAMRSPMEPTSSRVPMRPLAASASCSAPSGSAPSCSALRHADAAANRQPRLPAGLPAAGRVRPGARHDRTTQEPADAGRRVRPARPRACDRPSRDRRRRRQRRRRGRSGHRPTVARDRRTSRPHRHRRCPTKRWLLTHARALAYPSLDEGFGFPILEAQQAGTPVVASTAGSIPQIAGAAALLSPGSRRRGARRQPLLDRRPTTRCTPSSCDAATPTSQRFSWASTAAQYHAMYEELAADA